MDRRELLKMIAVVTGGAVIGGELFLTGCKTGAKTSLHMTPYYTNVYAHYLERKNDITKSPWLHT